MAGLALDMIDRVVLERLLFVSETFPGAIRILELNPTENSIVRYEAKACEPMRGNRPQHSCGRKHFTRELELGLIF